ncbi:MAG: hypothetical protein K2F85_02115, partial [Helicobacter sp.]|nr:hypothetical protein [Helicobacter sp.]
SCRPYSNAHPISFFALNCIDNQANFIPKSGANASKRRNCYRHCERPKDARQPTVCKASNHEGSMRTSAELAGIEFDKEQILLESLQK